MIVDDSLHTHASKAKQINSVRTCVCMCVCAVDRDGGHHSVCVYCYDAHSQSSSLPLFCPILFLSLSISRPLVARTVCMLLCSHAAQPDDDADERRLSVRRDHRDESHCQTHSLHVHTQRRRQEHVDAHT